MATQTQELSPKAKEVLQRKCRTETKHQQVHKAESGEKKILQFNPEKIE
jgi:hypothetical protein